MMRQKYSSILSVGSLLLFFVITIPGFSQTKMSYKANVVVKILESSARFKNLTDGLEERIKNNGGKTYGIMFTGSPNPEKDFANSISKNYEINLHESYDDRMVVIARFLFDPAKQQLFELDQEDELKTLSFDKKLLPLFNKK
ncbi:MAG: hypothetical protein EOO87_10350 [Pedobacter sp.]|nr:MAG: hypothetical protein EOO87_10350 [Pedobacter sp.]